MKSNTGLNLHIILFPDTFHTAISSEQFFTLVANSQSRRMDDQRTAMPPAQNGKPSIPQIILTPGSPVAPRAASFRRTSLSQDQDSLTRPPPRSASFSPVSDKERMQYDNNISRKVSWNCIFSLFVLMWRFCTLLQMQSNYVRFSRSFFEANIWNE